MEPVGCDAGDGGDIVIGIRRAKDQYAPVAQHPVCLSARCEGVREVFMHIISHHGIKRRRNKWERLTVIHNGMGQKMILDHSWIHIDPDESSCERREKFGQKSGRSIGSTRAQLADSCIFPDVPFAQRVEERCPVDPARPRPIEAVQITLRPCAFCKSFGWVAVCHRIHFFRPSVPECPSKW